MIFGVVFALSTLTASTLRAQAPQQCFYADWLNEPRPAPCPESARYPDQLPPPPRGTVWLPVTGRPRVYKAERLLRHGPGGIAYDGPAIEGASLPAIRSLPDGRLAPERFPDGPRPDGGREISDPRAPGGRACAFVILTERDSAGNFYGETTGPCPEDHASRGLGTPPPGHVWARVGEGKKAQMRLARFVVPSSDSPPPDAPPGPVRLLRSVPDAATEAAPSAARQAPATPQAPRNWAGAADKPASAPAPDLSPLLLLALIVSLVVGGLGYFFGRRRSAPERPSFAAAWTRPGAPPIPTQARSPGPTRAPPPAPVSGLLNGRYEFKGKIGEGGMGLVFEGFDHSLGRKVAIKSMRAEIAKGEGSRDAFLSEAKIISHLSHPYIVSIHEVVENEDGLFLVFDFVDGEPLSSVLQRRGRLPLAECVKVFTFVCEAIACAHRARVLHRDLKPSNIMIDSAGYAKVMDFGIAREAKETITRLTNIEASGTPAFMAPEQHLGRCAKTSDIYALGVCLYQAMTGSLPFQGPDFLAQKERMKYAPPQFLAPELPKEVEFLFAATLAADPKHRVADAAELIDSLKSLRI